MGFKMILALRLQHTYIKLYQTLLAETNVDAGEFEVEKSTPGVHTIQNQTIVSSNLGEILVTDFVYLCIFHFPFRRTHMYTRIPD